MAPSPLTVGLLQLNSSSRVEDNLAVTENLIRKAAREGAGLVVTPEMTTSMDTRRGVLAAASQAEETALALYRDLCKELGVWLVIGSMAVRIEGGRLANRCFVIDDGGDVRAHYDKIHMFDVDLSGGESYRESDLYVPGDHAVVVKSPWGALGLSICYDVRFPCLYRDLAQAGARIFLVPAAFTRHTGAAHWHTLLRARAIENGAFVLAPAQVGRHDNGRDTYGHSLAVDPWGALLLDAGEEVGVYFAKLNPDAVDQARQKVPSLRHDRDYDVVVK